MPLPTLSLCMIVRNNAKILPNALTPLLPHVQEIVIVDTGSEDDTKDVIRRLAPGAKIFDFTPQTHPDAFSLDVEATWPTHGIPGPYSGKYMLGDFAAARQFGWQRFTCDYGLWIDSDDVVERPENLAVVLNDMVTHGVDTALFNYDYSTDTFGNVNTRLPRERIIRRTFGAYWKQPVHELCVPNGVGRLYGPDMVNIAHKRSQYGTPTDFHYRNLKILCTWFDKHKDDPNIDPRMLFYLGMEERGLWPERAIDHFKMYCGRSGWDEERAAAHVLIGQLHEKFNRREEAAAEFALATVEFPPSPDGLFGLARCAAVRTDWGKVIEYTERGWKTVTTDHGRIPQLMFNPMDRDYKPHILYSGALLETGQYERAIESCRKGLALVPDDPHLKGNLESCENNIRILAERARAGIKEAPPPGSKIPLNLRRDAPLDGPPVEMATDLMIAYTLQVLWSRCITDNPARALSLLDSLPPMLVGQPRVLEARQFTLSKLGAAPAPAPAAAAPAPAPAAIPTALPPPAAAPAPLAPVTATIGSRLDILCWTGPAWEEWTPRTPDTTGLGGSEIAAVCLMRELARRGHRVRVVGHPGAHGGSYDGVEYINFDHTASVAATSNPDVLIASRAPQALVDFPNAKSRYIWVHDVHFGEPVGRNMEGIQRADRIFCLSEWHRQHVKGIYPFLPPETLIVSRNGIDISRFAILPHKAQNRMIWASSPDRGLERMIELFPRIRAEVPDVELHVYYGTVTWEAIAKQRNDLHAMANIARYKHLWSTTPGVVYHGRVNQKELAEAYLASKVWGYPTWFEETSCISAMEAQAAGCVPVVAARAALKETVKHGVLIEPPETTSEFAGQFVNTIVKLLTDEPLRAGTYADPGRAHALGNLGWDKLAAEWETIFHETLAWKRENPIAGFGALS